MGKYFQRRNSIHSPTKPVQLEILNVPEGLQVSATTFSVAEIQHSDLVRNLTGSQHLKSYQSAWWSGELSISAGASSPGKFCCWEDGTRDLTPSWSLLTARLPRQTLAYHMIQCNVFIVYLYYISSCIVTRIYLIFHIQVCMWG